MTTISRSAAIVLRAIALSECDTSEASLEVEDSMILEGPINYVSGANDKA